MALTANLVAHTVVQTLGTAGTEYHMGTFSGDQPGRRVPKPAQRLPIGVGVQCRKEMPERHSSPSKNAGRCAHFATKYLGEVAGLE